MPMHTDPSVAQGNNPWAICIVTPAPTPRTRAGATGATQGAPRTQQASAPRPQDCARPCLCIAAPKHLSALTGTPLQNAQSRARAISGPYTFAHQRQHHTHEQVPPGQLREQPGPSGLLRARPQYCARPCSCIAVPRHLAALTGTPLQDAQGQGGQPQGQIHLHTSANARNTSRCNRGNPGSSPDPAGLRAPTTGLRAAVLMHRRARTCGSAHWHVAPERAGQGGNNPRAVYRCTPAPRPRPRADATGATQGAARTQRASAPRPQDCARPCACIAAPKHRSAPTGAPLQNAQSRAVGSQTHLRAQTQRAPTPLAAALKACPG